MPAHIPWWHLYINGTTVLHLSKDATKEYVLALPKDQGILDQYDVYCRAIYHGISKNMAAIEKLTLIRDFLLPKLMSGEIDVSTLEMPN